MNSLARLPLALALVLPLGACGASHEASTPDGAVLAGVAALRRSDVPAFVHLSFTEDQISEMRGSWGVEMMEPPDPEQAKEFAKTMAMFMSDGAEETLMAKLEPQLAAMKPQLELIFGMLEASVESAVVQADELGDLEKQQAQAMVKAIVQTLKRNDVCDPARARRSIGILCKAARKAALANANDVRALNFEQVLGKGSVLLAAGKDVLEVYGFSLDDVLDSVSARTVTESGTEATVEISYELLGTTHTQTAQMTRVAGRWVAKRDEAAPEVLSSGLSIPR